MTTSACWPRARGAGSASAAASTHGRVNGQQAAQLHGGMGMIDDLFIGHALKRLMAIDAPLGRSDWHLHRMAALVAV